MNLSMLNPGSIPEVLRKALEMITDRANTVFAKEHNNSDGTHTTVTVTMLKMRSTTAPTRNTDVAQIYVDSADGDLKILFKNGTSKTIATD